MSTSCSGLLCPLPQCGQDLDPQMERGGSRVVSCLEQLNLRVGRKVSWVKETRSSGF